MGWISEESLAVGVPASTWQDVVRAAGGLLVDIRAAEPRYIAAMLRTAEELGPYIVLAPGLALPHARTEDGALRVGFAAITLAAPVEFGNPDNDPVRLVIAFCAPDSTAHLQALSQLARALEEPGFIDRAAAARHKTELAAILNAENAEGSEK
ncbi:MAG TPA: PTS sugar transporter subunit IIA [Levilinea sp.]|nr:PTS sugar transporter subunit IIA [Levilinea sp.]